MTANEIVGLNLVLSTVAFILIARWYVMPRLRAMPRNEALQPLLFLHTFRHIGMMFLSSGATWSELPSAFAVPAAYGDLAASILAFLALIALRFRWTLAIPLVWIFNIEGTVDLLYAVTRGIIEGAAEQMGATIWTPAIIVPALLVTHGMIFLLLIRPAKSA